MKEIKKTKRCPRTVLIISIEHHNNDAISVNKYHEYVYTFVIDQVERFPRGIN